MMNTHITTITVYDVVIRLSVAVLLGAVLGVEREYKRRPAGLRTHMLVCLGAAMTTLTSQYLLLNMQYYTDIARLGAQVIAGVGFIGTGTIIVFRGQQIKGLTTAAGLWTSAIMGLTVGAGFYIAAIVTAVFVILIESVFSVIERKLLTKSSEISIILEYTDRSVLARVFEICKNRNIRVQHAELTNKNNKEENYYAVLFLRLNKNITGDEITEILSKDDGIVTVKLM